MQEEIKPCPFCGGEADLCRHTYEWSVKVLCLKCGAIGEEKRGGKEADEAAIKAWNTRTAGA
jgi:Lar family restriction alleviation protein